MALFGKKKGAAPDSPIPDSSTASESSRTNDESVSEPFDSGAPNGASPFDDLLSSDNPNAPAASGSAFDFPDSSADVSANTVELDDIFGTDSTQTSNAAPDPFALNAPQADSFPIAPNADPFDIAPAAVSASVAAPEPVIEPETEGDASVAVAPQRKKLPLLPILAALGALVLAGGAYVLTQNSGVDETETPAVLPQRVNRGVDETIANNAASSTNAAPQNLSSKNTLPSSTNANESLNPQIAAQLKTLWEQGANAKHSGDARRARGESGAAEYANARRSWTQALQIRPGHPGFQESIDKLPQ